MGTLKEAKELLTRYQQVLRDHAKVVLPIPRDGCSCTMCILDNETTEFLTEKKPKPVKFDVTARPIEDELIELAKKVPQEDWETMNVKEIIKKYLQENFFDGLYCPGECACELDDLFPCGEGDLVHCQPGYRGPCDCGDHDFHIGPKPLKGQEPCDF